MEECMKPRAHNKGAAAAALAMHRDSHRVSKMKPKIRIIHIFAPEIIKTDVENFRELVQRLTGQPTKGIDGRNKKKKKKAAAAARPRAIHPPEYREASQVENVKREIGEEEEEEEGEEGRKLWVEGSSGGFLNGLEEDDDVDFFHGFGEYSLFPFLSMDDVQQ